MDEEPEVDGKRIPSNISYPRAAHYAVSQMRALDEKISSHVISDNDPRHILKEQQRIYSKAERIQRNHNYRDRRKG